MNKIEAGEIVPMTGAEIIADLQESIKKYAGIDVQILHRFAFEVEIEGSVKVVIKVFDRYKEKYLDNLTFSTYFEALSYLRGRYKKTGVEYEVCEKPTTVGAPIPKPEKKVGTMGSKKKHIPDFTIKDFIELDGLREKDMETFTKEMVEDYYKYGDALKDYLVEESTDR